MYGNKVDAGLVEHDVFKYGVPIPINVIKDEKTMKLIRSFYKYNIDLPGNVEDIHPLKFAPNLVPVEEFRYTAINPIPEKDLQEYQKSIEQKKRSKEYFELDKSKLRFYLMSILFGVIIYKTFNYVAYKGERINYELEKIRLRRFRYREEDDFI